MAAAGAALRLRLLYRMLRAGEVLALVALLSWSSARVPSAAAAALRFAGSLLLNARFVFVLGNAIVLLLLALSRHEHDVSPSPAPASPPQPQAAPADASTGFPSFATPSPPPPEAGPAETTTGFPSPTTPPPALELAPAEAAAEPSLPREKPLARAPRRSRSEKMRLRAARRALSPDPTLRRSESENGRRRSSVTARDAEACWGADDAEEFRRTVEAFIARQTRFFHREESMGRVRGGGGPCKADAPAIAAGALAVVE